MGSRIADDGQTRLDLAFDARKAGDMILQKALSRDFLGLSDISLGIIT